jgi:hypothetical protein
VSESTFDLLLLKSSEFSGEIGMSCSGCHLFGVLY